MGDLRRTCRSPSPRIGYTGAGGKIAVEALRVSAPDGGAMLRAPLVTPVLSQLVFKTPGYDPGKDMTPIGLVGHFQFALAAPQNHPAKSMPEFVAWLKANKDKANFGSPSPGSLPHFFSIMLGRAIGVDMVHVAYKDAVGSGWYSRWAPAKTPPATIAALNRALNLALANADAREKLARTGTEPTTSTPEGLEKFRLAEIEKWRPVIAASGFKAD